MANRQASGNLGHAVDLDVGCGPEASTTGPLQTAISWSRGVLQMLRIPEQHRTMESGVVGHESSNWR